MSLDDVSITLAPRGVQRVIPPRALHFGEGLRPRSPLVEADGLCFGTWRSGALKLVQALQESGVTVD
jgi:hypothetical protein